MRWLLLAAAATGWGALTRPLTMLAFAIPLGAIVVRDVWRRDAWRQLLAAFALGTGMIAIIPLWSARTTGDWRTTPVALYTRDYQPSDVLAFEADTTPARLPVPPT